MKPRDSFSVAAALVCGLLLTSTNAPVQAQVAWGAGFVDAPFVHVDWYHGRVHVVAPFVCLYANVPGYCEPACQTPPAVETEVSRQPNQPLARQLTASAAQLSRSLEQFDTAASWQHYLAVAPGEALSPEQRKPTASRATADRLEAILRHFDSTSANADFRVIHSLPAFQQTHDLLAQYVQRTTLASSRENQSPYFGMSVGPNLGSARDIARSSIEELPPPVPDHNDRPIPHDETVRLK